MREVAAHPFDGQILNGAQQLCLRRCREIGHFVEEQRTAVGVFELSAAPADACRRPLFDAKELGLQECFDKGRAVDGDERTGSAGAPLMDLPRDELLAHTALPLDEDGKIGGGDARDSRSERLYGRRGADHRARALLRSPDGHLGGSRELEPRAFDLQNQGADLGGRSQDL